MHASAAAGGLALAASCVRGARWLHAVHPALAAPHHVLLLHDEAAVIKELKAAWGPNTASHCAPFPFILPHCFFQIIKELKADMPAWVSKYARGGSARTVSARKLYVVADAISGHFASNG